MKNKKKLLLLSDATLYKKDGTYYSKDTFLKFVLHLEKYFDRITVCCPVTNTDSTNASLFRIPLNEPRILEIVPTYPYRSVIDYYVKLPLILFYNLPVLIRAIKETDMIFLRIPAMNAFAASHLAGTHGKPLFSYFVGDERSILETGSKYKGFKSRIALMVSRFHGSLYSKIISSTKASFFLSSELKEEYGKQSANSYLIFTSLVDEKIIPENNSFHDFNGTKNLLYVGRLSHEKGLQHLIRSVKYMVDNNLNVKLSICGDGPEREDLKTLIGKLGLDDLVHFYGFIPWGEELSTIYSESHIFILPSVSEGIPKVLLEAMAMGVPIIATNVGGIPDIITNTDNGILVTPGNPDAIADAVKSIINDDVLREKLIGNGYSFVREHTAEKQAEKLASLMHKHVA